MKPTLMIGAGNPLAGDDGIGAALIDDIARIPAWSRCAEFAAGGCDLLRLAGLMEGRETVVVIDAVLDEDAPPGTVSLHTSPFTAFANRSGGAHQLSAVEALDLLRAVSPGLRGTRFLLVTIAVRGLGRDAVLAAQLPRISARVRALLGPALRLPGVAEAA